MRVGVEAVQMSLAPLALSLLALFPPQAGAPSQGAPASTPDLSGRYRLNENESEDARGKLGQAGAGRRPGGPASGGGGPRGPRGAGGAQSMRGLIEGPKAMTVTHTPGEIAVLEDDGRLRTLHADDKTYKAEAGAVEVKSSWDGQRLLVETKSERGPKVSEAWSLDAAGKLTISTTLDSPQGAVSIKRVYDREAAAS